MLSHRLCFGTAYPHGTERRGSLFIPRPKVEIYVNRWRRRSESVFLSSFPVKNCHIFLATQANTVTTQTYTVTTPLLTFLLTVEIVKGGEKNWRRRGANNLPLSLLRSLTSI